MRYEHRMGWPAALDILPEDDHRLTTYTPPRPRLTRSQEKVRALLDHTQNRLLGTPKESVEEKPTEETPMVAHRWYVTSTVKSAVRSDPHPFGVFIRHWNGRGWSRAMSVKKSERNWTPAEYKEQPSLVPQENIVWLRYATPLEVEGVE